MSPPPVRPPRWARALLLVALPPGLVRDGVLGDLEEELRDRAASASPGAARRRYARRAVGVAVRFAVHRLRSRSTPSSPGDGDMLRARLDDLAQGLRSLAHAPGFTVLAVLTLAAGVGSTTAIFSVVDGVLLRPLPYPDGDRVVALRLELDGEPMASHSEPEWLDYEGVGAFAAVAAWSGANPTLGSADEPRRIRALTATASLFPVLGVEPALGRAFTPEEDVLGGHPVVVVSHGLWAGPLGGDPGVVGRTILLEDRPVTVVGVMPEGFVFPEADAQALLPLGVDRADPVARNNHYLRVVARLAPGVALPAAEAELAALGTRSSEAWPDFYATPVSFRARPLRDTMVGDVRAPLLLLMGAVVAVLLVASVNAAALFLARGESRRGEIAVRTALGAGRGRIAGQLLAESLTVAGGAALAGVALARGGVAALRALAPPDLPRLDEVALDGRVLAFGVGIALATGLLFGLAPALQALGGDVRAGLAGAGGRTAGGRRSGRFRRGLVVVQVALATLLAVWGGLLTRSFAALRHVELGFQPRGALVVPVSPSVGSVAPNADAVDFYRRLEARVAALPGVEAVGSGYRIPLAGGHDNYSIQVDGRPLATVGDAPAPGINWVTPGFFGAMGIALREGRLPTAADRADAPPVAVVNQRLAAELWPGESAVGKRVRMFAGDSPWVEVVGVVADVKHYGVREEASTKLYIPHLQGYVGGYYSPNRMSLVVRTSGDPVALAAPVREAVRALDPSIPLGEARPLEAVASAALARDRFTLLLLGAFAAVALLLAAVGVYGVVARAVASRTREIGLRMAVGADRSAIAGAVVAEALLLAAVGCGVGVAGAVALGGALRALLYGVSPVDVASYAVAVGVLVAVAGLASLVPASRAAGLDPVRALREG